jgi:hypothetical protein
MSRCECPKESVTQSPLSPGLVANDEPIAFGLIEPLSFKDGEVIVSHSQLRSGSLSICRAQYITAEQAREKIVDDLIAKDSTRLDRGHCWAPCHAIRAITLIDPKTREDTGVGAFCVIDDALPKYDAHAHIGYSEPQEDRLRNSRQAARAQLADVIKVNGIMLAWSAGPFAQP